jgi:AcrR family transcriptional regulator
MSPRTRAAQQQETRQAVVDAADALFVARGFHATSVEQIASRAGYTKGAVYSNFASKEDLFFAVYERRAARGEAEMRATIAERGEAVGFETLALEAARRRGVDDGWLAVFFEFWAHAVRRPELRGRFAAIHLGAQRPLVDALEDHARTHGIDLPDDARRLTVALYAMQLGLSLERLVLPDLVDERLGQRMSRLFLDDLAHARDLPLGDDDDPRLRAQAAG